jgi:hypothetical protein
VPCTYIHSFFFFFFFPPRVLRRRAVYHYLRRRPVLRDVPGLGLSSCSRCLEVPLKSTPRQEAGEGFFSLAETIYETMAGKAAAASMAIVQGDNPHRRPRRMSRSAEPRGGGNVGKDGVQYAEVDEQVWKDGEGSTRPGYSCIVPFFA